MLEFSNNDFNPNQEIVLKNEGDFIVFKQSFSFFTKKIKQVSFEDVLILNQNLNNLINSGFISVEVSYGNSLNNLSSFNVLNQNLKNNIENFITNEQLNKDEVFFIFFIKFYVVSTLSSEIKITENDFKISFKQIYTKDIFKMNKDKLLVQNFGNVRGLTFIPKPSFNPYKIDQSLNYEKHFSQFVNLMFGLDALYFKLEPDKNNEDVVIFEYTITNVSKPVCLKVLIPNNEIEDYKFKYSQFGIDFENELEIHIDKQYFEKFFGKGKSPQKGDIVYLKAFPSRVYEIFSSYLVRGLMFQDLYFACSLKKYQPKASRKETKEVRDFLDSITTSLEEEFIEKESEIYEDITNPKQLDYNIGDVNKTKPLDTTRLKVNNFVESIIDKNEYKGLLISNFAYFFKEVILNDSLNSISVVYKPTLKELNNNIISYLCWFKNVNYGLNEFLGFRKYNISSMTFNSTTNELSCSVLYSSININVNDLVLIKNNYLDVEFFGTVVQKTSISGGWLVKIQLNQEVVNYLNNSFIGWSSLLNFSISKTHPKNFISNFNGTSNGFEINLIGSKFVELKIFETSTKNLIKVIPIDYPILENEFYCLYLNYNSTFKDLFVSVLNKNVEVVFTYKENNLLELDFINGSQKDSNFVLKTSSDFEITNIRLFKVSIEDFNVSKVASQNVLLESSKVLIVDNAIPVNKNPYIGRIV